MSVSSVYPAIAPTFALSFGMLIGLLSNFLPIKILKKKAILVTIVGVFSAVGLLSVAMYFADQLPHIYLLDSFSSAIKPVLFSNSLFGNLQLTAFLFLVAVFEAGLASGFLTSVKLAKSPKKNKIPLTSVPDNQTIVTATNGAAGTVSSIMNAASVTTQSVYLRSTDATDTATKQGLQRDEQAIIELFLYGKVTQVISTIDTSKPEGYTLEGMPQLGWDIKKSRQILDSLVRKGFLKAELTDKMLVCKTCGSANVQFKRMCPDCRSLRLSKEGLIEHFACGNVEKQDAFERANGDLTCPKCRGKLQLIGSDYRKLPPAYRCLECNNLSSEPLLAVKCKECETTAEADEEPEVFLYAYSINTSLQLKEIQQIKPVEACTKFFKSLGYTIVAPAFVSGKSGTQHLFDILILGRVGWIEQQSQPSGSSTVRRDNGNTVVEVLISSKPVDMEEITRMYGMINDVECDALIFAIPEMTESARNYATAYHMKVSEGRTIEEALANSKIPRAAGNGT